MSTPMYHVYLLSCVFWPLVGHVHHVHGARPGFEQLSDRVRAGGRVYEKRALKKQLASAHASAHGPRKFMACAWPAYSVALTVTLFKNGTVFALTSVFLVWLANAAPQGTKTY